MAMGTEDSDISQVIVEKQVALLMAQVESLSRDNERLARDNAEMASEMSRAAAALESELEAVRIERDRLLELVKLANQRMFGCKSEKVIPDQLSLFNDMEAAADDSAEPALEDAIQPKPRRRGGKRKIDYSKLEQVIIRHDIPESERACPECGETLTEMKVEVTYAVRMVPAHLVAERHERIVYRCESCCSKNAKDGSVASVIVRSPQPALPIPHSFATPSLIAYVINGKYVNALPLYRMEYDFKCLGVDISRQNMANWVMRSYERWLSLIATRMKTHLLEGQRLGPGLGGVAVIRLRHGDGHGSPRAGMEKVRPGNGRCRSGPATLPGFRPSRSACFPWRPGCASIPPRPPR